MTEIGSKRAAYLLCGAIAISGAVVLAYSASSIHGFADAVGRRAPIIVWDEHSWTGLPIALSILALALCLLVGAKHGVDTAGRREKAMKYLLALSASILPFAIVLPFSAHWLVGRHLEAQGYNECIDGVWVAVGRVPDVPETPPPCRGLSD